MEIYTCRCRDNLYSIARRYSTDPDTLARVNRLNTAYPLPEGLSLMIPSLDYSSKKTAQLFLCTSRRLPESLSMDTMPYLSGMVFCTGRLMPDGTLASASFAEAARFREGGVLPVLSVSNRGENSFFDADAVHRLLFDSSSRAIFTQQASKALENGGFSGLCLQFNYLHPFDKASFSLLLEELSHTLHSKGKYLMLSASPKLSEQDADSAAAALDYSAIGSFCDKVLLQSYDWGNSSNAPQSCAPLHMLRQSLEYALNHIPGNKLLLGFSDHGYRWCLPWRQGSTAEPVSHDIAQALAVSNSAAIRFDRLSQTPFFSFHAAGHQRCVVWFEDVKSLYAKLSLINEYALSGAAVFSSFHVSPVFLHMMQEMFNIEKFL